jgi:hypothetical protein
MILRVQNKQGRGPWMPGLSSKWVDSFRTAQHPPIYDERPDYLDHVANAHKRGMHIGCAVRGREGLLSWFSPMEIFRLYDLGLMHTQVEEDYTPLPDQHSLANIQHSHQPCRLIQLMTQ